MKSPLNFEGYQDLSPESGSDRICLGRDQRSPNAPVCITAFNLIFYIISLLYPLWFINSASGYKRLY